MIEDPAKYGSDKVTAKPGYASPYKIVLAWNEPAIKEELDAAAARAGLKTATWIKMVALREARGGNAK